MKIPFVLFMTVLMIAAGDLIAVPKANMHAEPSLQADCNCIEVRRIRGNNCGRQDSLRIEFRNVCAYAVNAQIYARGNRDGERQRVGGPTSLRPGAASSYFWCQEPSEVVVACE